MGSRGKALAAVCLTGACTAVVAAVAPPAVAVTAAPTHGRGDSPVDARSPAPAGPPAVEQCRLADPALDEVSGLAADGHRWYAVNDGGSELRIHVLGRDCSAVDTIVDPADPYDVEDLARADDGTFWLGDVGDNRGVRDTVALHALRPGGGSTLHRLTYPDGAHDAEALLLDGSGTPLVITKSMAGASAVYRPAGPLRAPGPTALEKVGDLPLAPTATPGGPAGPAGSLLVTGADTSHDGRVVAVRTYTDVYLYAVPDGDVVAALRGDPVRVPLPDEPQGEAIAFEPDGALVSMSEGTGTAVRVVADAASLVSDGTGPGDDGEGSDDAAGRQAHPRRGSTGDGSGPDAERAADRRAHEDTGDAGVGLSVLPVAVAAAVALGVSATVRGFRRR